MEAKIIISQKGSLRGDIKTNQGEYMDLDNLSTELEVFDLVDEITGKKTIIFRIGELHHRKGKEFIESLILELTKKEFETIFNFGKSLLNE